RFRRRRHGGAPRSCCSRAPGGFGGLAAASRGVENPRKRAKGTPEMPKTKDVKPYVERAIKDEEFRDNLKSAFVAARDVYDELMGPRGVSGKAVRVASDKDLRDNLRSAIDDLRNAADRIQRGPSHKGRNLLL